MDNVFVIFNIILKQSQFHKSMSLVIVLTPEYVQEILSEFTNEEISLEFCKVAMDFIELSPLEEVMKLAHAASPRTRPKIFQPFFDIIKKNISEYMTAHERRRLTGDFFYKHHFGKSALQVYAKSAEEGKKQGLNDEQICGKRWFFYQFRSNGKQKKENLKKRVSLELF